MRNVIYETVSYIDILLNNWRYSYGNSFGKEIACFNLSGIQVKNIVQGDEN